MAQATEAELQAELAKLQAKPKPRILLWLWISLGAIALAMVLQIFSMLINPYVIAIVNQYLISAACIAWTIIGVNLSRRAVTRIGIRRIINGLNMLHQHGVIGKPRNQASPIQAG